MLKIILKKEPEKRYVDFSCVKRSVQDNTPVGLTNQQQTKISLIKNCNF